MTEALRMLGSQTNVFVHVEDGHVGPDDGLAHERGQEFMLRGRAGKDYSRLTPRCTSIANRLRNEGSGGGAEGSAVGILTNFQKIKCDVSHDKFI